MARRPRGEGEEGWKECPLAQGPSNPSDTLLTAHSLSRTNEELVAFLSKNRDKNFLKSHGRDSSR